MATSTRKSLANDKHVKGEDATARHVDGRIDKGRIEKSSIEKGKDESKNECKEKRERVPTKT